MSVNARELGRLIELNKERAELEFHKSILGVECEAELKSLNSSIAEIEGKARKADVDLVIPQAKKVDDLSRRLEDFSSDQITEALKSRSGEAYEILRERGAIAKKNHENRLEIGKLSLLLARAPNEVKEKIKEAVLTGAANGSLPLDSLDEGARRKLIRFMRRCGIETDVPPEPEEKEVRIELRSRSVWVNESEKEKLEGNMRRMEEITPSIHLKNAQRHVKVFSEDEEQEFASLQREYLDLLKEQDELLREFNEEEKSAK
jgi:hypothetical protein